MRPLRPNFDYRAPELDLRSAAEILEDALKLTAITAGCFLFGVALVVVGLWMGGYFR